MGDYVNLNTLFGAVIVLAIVVLIMLVTYFVNIKPNLNTSFSETAPQSTSVDKAIAQIVETEEELVSDCELVAVITAAIYASLGDAVPAEGLVVRSIRRSNAGKWKNA
ncbi:hypothetical protein HNQ56_002465 [Anaerotaenia torta]|uniref:OadG family protein n=1 Tax=Anaerotaenia torta TaxID=433293 RepID=UPI003D1E78E0